MRLLLDTHIALWAVLDSPRLSAHARSLILAPNNDLFVSAASVWEVAIKHRIAPKKMPVTGGDALSFFRRAGYHMLAVTAEHAAALDDLPAYHNDPFDRLLVTQAMEEPLRLLTSDAVLARYSGAVIVA